MPTKARKKDDRWTDGHQTITLRLPLDVGSIKTVADIDAISVLVGCTNNNS